MSEPVDPKTHEQIDETSCEVDQNTAKFSKAEIVNYIADMTMQLSVMAREHNLSSLQSRLIDVYNEASCGEQALSEG